MKYDDLPVVWRDDDPDGSYTEQEIDEKVFDQLHRLQKNQEEPK